MTYHLSPELCTCSNTFIYAQSSKVPGTVTLSKQAYGVNICNEPRISELLASDCALEVLC